MKRVKHIFFTAPSHASFVRKDIEILTKKFIVYLFLFQPKKKILTPIFFWKQLYNILIRVLQTNIYISQFAGYHTVLPTIFSRIFGKKHAIILGGTESNWLPSIGYGNHNIPLLRAATKFSLKYSSLLLPVNKELVFCTYSYTETESGCLGYKSLYPDVKTPHQIIPNGIDLSTFTLHEGAKRNLNTFVTLCGGLEDERRRKVKGVDLIIALAETMIDSQFTVIGGKFPQGVILPKNITTIEYVDNKQLPELFNTFTFYLQLSMTEGFPNALLEAMGCGCIPIVSSAGAMPEIVKGYGYILQHKNLEELQALVSKAFIEYDPEMHLRSHERAMQYQIKFREKALLETITTLLT